MASTPVIGSPSSQCACSGHARTAAVNAGSWRSAFSGRSPVAAYSVTDHVPLSAGSVSTENDSNGVRNAERGTGGSPR